jgi:hypothetical protein
MFENMLTVRNYCRAAIPQATALNARKDWISRILRKVRDDINDRGGATVSANVVVTNIPNNNGSALGSLHQGGYVSNS